MYPVIVHVWFSIRVEFTLKVELLRSELRMDYVTHFSIEKLGSHSDKNSLTHLIPFPRSTSTVRMCRALFITLPTRFLSNDNIG